MPTRSPNFRQLHEASELLLEKLEMLSPAQRAAFDEKFLISWIFHDFALEGTVLSVAEIKAAIDPEIISNPHLIPAYNYISSLRDGIDHVMESRGKRLTLNLDWLKRVHYVLLPEDKKDQIQYRKDNLIHRPYFHDLASPDKISYRMRKLTDWFRTQECKDAHPIELACAVHKEIIRILPWSDISGRVARLAMNHILVNESFWPALIHHVDRQRYYDALQRDHDELRDLVVHGMEEGMKASNRLYQSIVDQMRPF
jgi:Fic family protein